MKKIITAILLAAMLAALLCCGCAKPQQQGPAQITVPGGEPTDKPASADPADVDGIIGDWYGVFYVTAAAGAYQDNANVRNDCAMRAAIDGSGRGVCYLVINGLGADPVSGSANVFALCTAELDGKDLLVKGMINRSSVEWRFVNSGSVLKLSEFYGDGADSMSIEIILARPDALETSGLRYDAAEYIAANGCGGIVDKLGGSTAELPELVPAGGGSAHDFFTEGGAPMPTEPADEGRVMGANGVSLSIPEGYVILQKDSSAFVVASPSEHVLTAEFTMTSWNSDALSFLLVNAPEADEICHYFISGFDFYGTFINDQMTADSSTVFKLCGSNGAGRLAVVTIVLDLDREAAYSFANLENASFEQLVLGAKFGK